MGTQYKSVADMIRQTSDDQEFNEELLSDIKKRQIVKTLFAIRSAKGVSQSQIAEILNVTQSRISKIENGEDGDLRFRELEAYARALDCQMEIAFMSRQSTGADRVKYHVACIQGELKRIASCVGNDESLAKGVAAFFGEAFLNMVHVLQNACSLLPKRDNQKPYIDINLCEPHQVEQIDNSDEGSSKVKRKRSMAAVQ